MLLFRHASALAHEPGTLAAEHPDAPERIRVVEARLAEADWCGADLREAPAASLHELTSVHDIELVERVQLLCDRGGGAIDEDTFVTRGSFLAAQHAAGGAAAMTRALLDGEDRAGFCLTRPSGHHAERDRAMGFCLFNNVAVAAELAVTELGAGRVLVIDWDVHHGNGTAEIFRRRADVLVASIHQSGLYPATGAAGDCGSGPGSGYTLNIPVPAGSEEDTWVSILEHLIVPVGREFRPGLILISAGFDAHRLDPLGGCRLEAESYAQMAAHVRALADELAVPVGAVLEGGYHPEALAASIVATLPALDGRVPAESIAPEMIVTPRAAARIGHFWELS